MNEKCKLCEEEIGRSLLDKIDGTVIKVKKSEGEKNQIVHICSACQKKYKDNLKKEILKQK